MLGVELRAPCVNLRLQILALPLESFDLCLMFRVRASTRTGEHEPAEPRGEFSEPFQQRAVFRARTVAQRRKTPGEGILDAALALQHRRGREFERRRIVARKRDLQGLSAVDPSCLLHLPQPL